MRRLGDKKHTKSTAQRGATPHFVRCSQVSGPRIKRRRSFSVPGSKKKSLECEARDALVAYAKPECQEMDEPEGWRLRGIGGGKMEELGDKIKTAGLPGSFPSFLFFEEREKDRARKPTTTRLDDVL